MERPGAKLFLICTRGCLIEGLNLIEIFTFFSVEIWLSSEVLNEIPHKCRQTCLKLDKTELLKSETVVRIFIG